MANRRITLVFPQDQIQQPVVFQMAKEFNVVPNIRRARVTDTVGEMTLELEGPEETLTKAIQYLEDKGIEVQSADGRSVV